MYLTEAQLEEIISQEVRKTLLEAQSPLSVVFDTIFGTKRRTPGPVTKAGEVPDTHASSQHAQRIALDIKQLQTKIMKSVERSGKKLSVTPGESIEQLKKFKESDEYLKALPPKLPHGPRRPHPAVVDFVELLEDALEAEDTFIKAFEPEQVVTYAPVLRQVLGITIAGVGVTGAAVPPAATTAFVGHTAACYLMRNENELVWWCATKEELEVAERVARLADVRAELEAGETAEDIPTEVGADGVPPEIIQKNEALIKKLIADIGQQKYIAVNNTTRTPEQNADAEGVEDSYHLLGAAVDLVPKNPEVTVEDIMTYIFIIGSKDTDHDNYQVNFGKVIFEGDHVHVVLNKGYHPTYNPTTGGDTPQLLTNRRYRKKLPGEKAAKWRPSPEGGQRDSLAASPLGKKPAVRPQPRPAPQPATRTPVDTGQVRGSERDPNAAGQSR
jgi:hypothetical protein